MSAFINLAILEDHQAIIDGYIHRLEPEVDIQVVATPMTGEELEPALAKQPVDVLILDVSVPVSDANPNPYPLLPTISRLLERYANLAILIISNAGTRSMVSAVPEAGAVGYILKDDRAAMQDLATIVRVARMGGIYLSPKVSGLLKERDHASEIHLSARQIEALSYCAAYPDLSTAEIAARMQVAPSTVRNTLSSAYVRLDVSSRAAAVARARALGLLSPEHG